MAGDRGGELGFKEIKPTHEMVLAVVEKTLEQTGPGYQEAATMRQRNKQKRGAH